MSPQQSADRRNAVDLSALSGDPALDSLQATAWQARGSIGPYQLIEPIGSGGMGEVWLAEQTQPVRRRVALKLIKAGMDTGEVVARFQSERQALALMDHPSIAKVFDAGSTPQGRPYFAMEYIAGIPITTYCDQHKMALRQRLQLFMLVCDGVQHAHQKAIIHRDLKPSNILVSEVDGKPVSRIIDFGVAKALSHEVIGESLSTQAGAILGTLAYMSPEQAGAIGADVDTRTDVYSLGAVLYELLVGIRPLDFHDVPFDEMLRRLREEEPPRPSTKAHQLRGDLDAIALKALEKDRSRRYGSPSELAADVGRHLRNEAVLAVPPSAAYRARKFARRYRAALVTAAAFALMLMVSAALIIRQSIRANSEAAVAQAVNDFLQNDLLAQASAANQSGPSAKPDPHLEVRTALDRAAARITGEFEKQPEVEASIRDTIGHTYIDLGLYPEARKQLERALALHRRALGAESPRTLKTMSRLGWIASLQGKYQQAEANLRQTLDAQRRVLGPERPDTLTSANTLANVYVGQGKYTQAEALLSDTLAIRRRVLGPGHPDTLASMNNLTSVYYAEGKYTQLEALDRQILDVKRRTLGPEHPDTLKSMSNLAVDYQAQGNYAQAEVLGSQTLAIERRVLGPEHPDTLMCMNNLGIVYYAQGKYGQAEPLLAQAFQARRRVMGAEHPHTLATMDNLADVYTAEARYAEAEVLFGLILEIQRRTLGSEHPDTLGTMNNLGNVYSAQSKYVQAEALLTQTLGLKRRVLGPEHPDTLLAVSDLASLYQRQDKYALAERYEAEALAGRRHALGSDSADTMNSAADLALAYLSQKKFAQSESLAREAVRFDRKNRADTWQRFRAESLLGASLAGQKKYAEAKPLLLEGYQGMAAQKKRMAAFDWYHLDRARQWLVQLYRAWGKPEKDAEWGKK